MSDVLKKYINVDVIRYLIITVVLSVSLILISSGDDNTDVLVGWVDAILLYAIGVRTNGNGQETGIDESTE